MPFEDWTSVLGSERLTGALLDRLTHHVSILTMNGDSYRLRQSASRQPTTTTGEEQNQPNGESIDPDTTEIVIGRSGTMPLLCTGPRSGPFAQQHHHGTGLLLLRHAGRECDRR